jgi:hypothetical protein
MRKHEWYNEAMGLYIRQDDNRSELQRRIAAELTEKARKKAELENQPLPDGVNDSAYIKDTQKTSRFAWVWLLLIAAAVVATLVFILN